MELMDLKKLVSREKEISIDVDESYLSINIISSEFEYEIGEGMIVTMLEQRVGDKVICRGFSFRDKIQVVLHYMKRMDLYKRKNGFMHLWN